METTVRIILGILTLLAVIGLIVAIVFALIGSYWGLAVVSALLLAGFGYMLFLDIKFWINKLKSKE